MIWWMGDVSKYTSKLSWLWLWFCFDLLISLLDETTTPVCGETIQINSEVIFGVDTSGSYDYLEMLNNKAVYKHETRDLYLFYAGWWKVDTSAIYNSNDNSAIGFIRSEVDVACPEMVNPGNWMYYDDNMDHSTISVTWGTWNIILKHIKHMISFRLNNFASTCTISPSDLMKIWC